MDIWNILGVSSKAEDHGINRWKLSTPADVRVAAGQTAQSATNAGTIPPLCGFLFPGWGGWLPTLSPNGNPCNTNEPEKHVLNARFEVKLGKQRKAILSQWECRKGR